MSLQQTLAKTPFFLSLFAARTQACEKEIGITSTQTRTRLSSNWRTLTSSLWAKKAHTQTHIPFQMSSTHLHSLSLSSVQPYTQPYTPTVTFTHTIHPIDVKRESGKKRVQYFLLECIHVKMVGQLCQDRGGREKEGLSLWAIKEEKRIFVTIT